MKLHDKGKFEKPFDARLYPKSHSHSSIKLRKRNLDGEIEQDSRRTEPVGFCFTSSRK